MKGKKKLIILFMVIILLSCSGGISEDTNNTTSNQALASTIVYREGSFELNNTAATVFMMEYGAQEGHIGTTYNFTIWLNITSTSAINVTVISYHTWKGDPNVFQVNQNGTITVTYVQHGTSDELGEINMKYYLLNTSGIAKGTYQVSHVFSGYPTFIGTGSLYVHNITSWLEAKSRTTILPTSTSTSLKSILTLETLFLLTAISGVLILKKRNRIE